MVVILLIQTQVELVVASLNEDRITEGIGILICSLWQSKRFLLII